MEWSKIRRSISREADLKSVPGASDLQKLGAWAEGQGLRMDFEYEFAGFSSGIRSITFYNGQPVAGDNATTNSGPQASTTCGGLELCTTPVAAANPESRLEAECTVCNDFDWRSVDYSSHGDADPWAALSRDADCIVIAR